MKAPDQRTGTLLGVVLLFGGALMLTYWGLYLTGLADLGQSDPVRAGFEAAFCSPTFCSAHCSSLRAGCS